MSLKNSFQSYLIHIGNNCVRTGIQINVPKIRALAARYNEIVKRSADVHDFHLSLLDSRIRLYNHHLSTPFSALDLRHHGRYRRRGSQVVPIQT